MPIKNPMDYELATLNRWLAMSVSGAGLMVDFDCLNNGFSFPDFKINKANILCGHVPCAVVATADQYETFAKVFILDKAQSDMHWLEANKDKFHSFDTCREYGTLDWQQAKLIHFAHYACKGRKRSEVMQEWMDRPKTTIKPIPPEMRDMVDAASTQLMKELAQSVEIVNVVKHHVDALAQYCTKDSFAKGRVRKALKAAKIIA